jgi:hypothetical protein
MGDVAGRVAAAISRMDQVRDEMAERRALRERRGAEIRARSAASLKQHAAATQQAARDLGAQARRQQAAGGWSTSTTDRDRNAMLGLGIPDDDEPPATAPPPASVAPGRTPPPAARRPVRPRGPDEDDDLSGHSWMVNR